MIRFNKVVVGYSGHYFYPLRWVSFHMKPKDNSIVQRALSKVCRYIILSRF